MFQFCQWWSACFIEWTRTWVPKSRGCPPWLSWISYWLCFTRLFTCLHMDEKTVYQVTSESHLRVHSLIDWNGSDRCAFTCRSVIASAVYRWCYVFPRVIQSQDGWCLFVLSNIVVFFNIKVVRIFAHAANLRFVRFLGLMWHMTRKHASEVLMGNPRNM
jgi:hypothetical protein